MIASMSAMTDNMIVSALVSKTSAKATNSNAIAKITASLTGRLPVVIGRYRVRLTCLFELTIGQIIHHTPSASGDHDPKG